MGEWESGRVVQRSSGPIKRRVAMHDSLHEAKWPSGRVVKWSIKNDKHSCFKRFNWPWWLSGRLVELSSGQVGEWEIGKVVQRSGIFRLFNTALQIFPPSFSSTSGHCPCFD